MSWVHDSADAMYIWKSLLFKGNVLSIFDIFKKCIIDDDVHIYFSELNRGEDQAFNIEERIIWNPFLDGVKQFLSIISFGPPTDGNMIYLHRKKNSLKIILYHFYFFILIILATECMADSVHDQSMWSVIFGATGGREYIIHFVLYVFHHPSINCFWNIFS